MGEPVADDALSDASGIPRRAIHDVTDLVERIAGRSVVGLAPTCRASEMWMERTKVVPAGVNEQTAIVTLRLRKDEYELTAMRRAADISVQGHLAAMLAAVADRRESDVVAALYSVFASHHCDVSFTPIVTVHGEVLHGSSGANPMRKGQLLLVDSGAEEPGGYASDITRTYPVGGKFSPAQRQIYDTVLKAQRAAVAACVPGRRYRDVHDLAARVVCEGLVDAGLLRGNPADLAGRYAHTLFFTHGVGHLIGLDVHDMEDFGDVAGYAPGRSRRPEFGNKFLRLDRDLVAGMTVTIEPGIYLVPALWRNEELVRPFADVVNRPAVEALLKAGFGGIRIEDTVHVRDPAHGGPEVLTGALPSDGDVVASIVGGA
jgi:Xaa-Pro aminopeptidase